MSAPGRSQARIPQRAARSAQGWCNLRAGPLPRANPAARSAQGWCNLRAGPLPSANPAARSVQGRPVNSRTPSPAPTVRCPACGGPSRYAPDNPWRPFCSQRCKLHDLGDWANERFRVAVQDDPDEPPAHPPH